MADHRPHQLHRLNPLFGETGQRAASSTWSMPTIPSCARRAHGRRGAIGVRLHDGVYIWFCGPSFETPAEIRAAAHAGRRRGRHVDRAGGHPGAARRPEGRRALAHHQFCRRHDARASSAIEETTGRWRADGAGKPCAVCSMNFGVRSNATHSACCRRRSSARSATAHELSAEEIAFIVRGITDGSAERGPGRGLRHGGVLPRHDAGRARWR